MKLLDSEITYKAKEEIIEIFSPLLHEISLIETGRIQPNILYSINSNRLTLAFSILSHKAIEDKEFKESLIKIKLNWYKRNLALLEILASKQNFNNISLAFKIIRENLGQKHISEHIDITHWYKAYITRRITKRLIEEIF